MPQNQFIIREANIIIYHYKVKMSVVNLFLNIDKTEYNKMIDLYSEFTHIFTLRIT